MHPFVQPFNPAISAPWKAKSDWTTFREIAKVFSELAKDHLPERQKELLVRPLGHDSEGEIAQEFGKIQDWRTGEVEAIPGKTMPNMQIVERDYTKIYEKMITIGPQLKKGYGDQAVTYTGETVFNELKARVCGSPYDGIRKEDQ